MSKCPECGKPMDLIHEPQVQEYPGAHVWPGCSYFQCTDDNCGYQSDAIKDEVDTGRIQENTRGW